MNGQADNDEIEEIDPSDLLEDLDVLDEAVLYTDDPSTPALIESLTPGSSLAAWMGTEESRLQIRCTGRDEPVAVWDDTEGWVQVGVALPVRGDADLSEPTPLNLVYALLSLGWRINATAEADRVLITATPPAAWDSSLVELAWKYRGLRTASPVTIALLNSDTAQFTLDDTVSGVLGSDGVTAPIDFDELLGLALAIAPTWLMPDAVAAEPNWHSHGGLTPATNLPSDPYSAVADLTDDEVAARKARLSAWVRDHHMTGPWATRAQVSSAIADNSPVGHYVLAFTDGSCYVGETVNFATRFAAHEKTYAGQIEAYYLRYDPTAAALPRQSKARKQQLLNAERTLIHDAQKNELVARNFREMANPIDPSPEFTALFSGASADETIARWFAHPDQVNSTDKTPLQPFKTSDFGGAKARLDRFMALPEASQVIRIVRAYLLRCVPFPALTEFRSWAISCLPNSKHGTKESTYSVIVCLSISRTESLTILREDWSQRVIGYLQANEIEAQVADDFGVVRLLRHHPGAALSPADYSEFGPGTVTVHGESLDALERLLDDTRITRAAATSALRLCRLGPSAQRVAHNPYIVERALAMSRNWSN
ncbi:MULTISPECIES: hypothetical protein [unclassified Gordonia (in: high G+C Gram-positive bacteria)]